MMEISLQGESAELLRLLIVLDAQPRPGSWNVSGSGILTIDEHGTLFRVRHCSSLLECAISSDPALGLCASDKESATCGSNGGMYANCLGDLV